MFNCFAELGPYKYQMYVLNTTVHRHQHVLNYVSGIKEASDVDCLQYRSLKMICYIHSKYVLKKKNEITLIFLNFILLCYSDLKHFGTKFRKKKNKTSEEVKHTFVCQRNATLFTEVSQYREPLKSGFTCQNVSPVPELLSPAEPVLEAFTAQCSSLVTRINLAH